MIFKEFLITEADEQLMRFKEYQDRIPMLKTAIKILNRIESKGFRAYIVGGYVRDLIIGVDPHDIDIAGNMPLDIIKKTFNTYGLSGDEFGIIGIKLDGFTFEYAMFRGETYQRIKGVRKIL